MKISVDNKVNSKWSSIKYNHVLLFGIILLIFFTAEVQRPNKTTTVIPNLNTLKPGKCTSLPYMERLQFLLETSGSRKLQHEMETSTDSFTEYEYLHSVFDIRTLFGTEKINYLGLYTNDVEDSLIVHYLSKHTLPTNIILSENRRNTIPPSIEKTKKNFDTTYSTISDNRIVYINTPLDIVYLGSNLLDKTIVKEVYNHQNINPEAIVIFSQSTTKAYQEWSTLVKSNTLFSNLGCLNSLCIYMKNNGKHTIDHPIAYNPEFFAIVMPTYPRPYGKTPQYLLRSLMSIKKQSFSCYHLYLIGDAYKNETELFEIINHANIDNNRITVMNLHIAGERGKGISQQAIWQIGGSSAVNQGLDLAVVAGHEWILHMDDDEWWLPHRLERMYKIIQANPGAAFAFHVCQGNKAVTWPGNWETMRGAYPYNALPEANKIIHSTFCHHIDVARGFHYPGVEKGKNIYEPGDITFIKYTQDWLAKHPERFSILLPEILSGRESEKEILASN